MTDQDQNLSGNIHDQIIDRIYEIALEPSRFEDFINFWHDTELAAQISDNKDGKPGEFDDSYRIHIDRAKTFLHRSEMSRSDLSEHLHPYKNLAAFIVGSSLLVEAANPGAFTAFGVAVGKSLDELELSADIRTALIQTTQDVLNNAEPSEKLLKADMDKKRGSILFRVVGIANTLDEQPAVLIVTTQLYWRETIGPLLGSTFQLTKSEQAIVRLLVDGQEVKSIAATRSTSEGTVRGQIKSIIGKMNLRSQTDIVRLAITLGKFDSYPAEEQSTDTLPASGISLNWLETEVWKPFKSVEVPDGRTLTYHDMGPRTGNPVLFSHMGSCMVRWPKSMIRLAHENNLRVICPIRAGYGHSDRLDLSADIFKATSEDVVFLLNSLGLSKLPYAVLGSDFPLAVDLAARHPDIVSELIGLGGRPCLPGGMSVDGTGRWQRFFVSTARHAPHMAQFASRALMAMSKRIGPEAMLRQLCKDSQSDTALLENEEMRQILVANISLMAGKSTNAARAFAMEYIAFHEGWSDLMTATRQIPTQIVIAEEDPTVDLSMIPNLQEAYPWIGFEIVSGAGLALIYQKPEKLISLMAETAKRTASRIQ